MRASKVVVALATSGLAASIGIAPATATATVPTQPVLSESSAAAPDAYDGTVDVLFIGAHPDDEASRLSTYGQWRQRYGVSTGVVTITRGEGGGNAIGPEEGPALGLIREAEERRAVEMADITDVHNLDDVDFYYTVSQPLTRQTWGHEQSLDKVVRVIRQTRPEIIVTMNPAPSPGNHGHHQEAARLAIEAFEVAGDPRQSPQQIRREGLKPWSPSRLFTTTASGSGPTGPECEAGFEPDDPSADTFGVWSGRRSNDPDKSWAQVQREAQREYASQGWAGFPDVPTDPAELGCDWFTQVDARVPYALGGTDEAAEPDAMLHGALSSAPGDLPVGTRFWLETDRFDVTAGEEFTVTAYAEGPRGRPLRGAAFELDVPEGWDVDPADGSGSAFAVTPVADAEPGDRERITGTLTHDGLTGTTGRAVRVAASVRATPQLLPQVAEYEDWATEAGVPQLTGSVLPRLPVGGGQGREVEVALENGSSRPQSGTVTLDLPDGFEADETSKPYDELDPGASGQVTFAVTADADLPTSNEGGDGGDHHYTITTTSNAGGSETVEAAFNVVPVTTIPQAEAAPAVDGADEPGEYPGEELDLSRHWEGADCESAADCSATAKISWHEDALYVIAHVTDDTLGAVVDAEDCKRHWRTDAVELALDARGTSENTSSTFKSYILPVSGDDAEPCFGRDADNHQGEGTETAPGMEVATVVDEPYTGYTVEAKIDLADLPNAVDPERLGLNLFVYDSDTDDLTGQTRIGWSTWGGVQGDPYRWGTASVDGYEPPADRPVEPVEPTVPDEAALSARSPQSILQADATGIALAGGPETPLHATGRLIGRPHLIMEGVAAGTVTGRLAASGSGTMHLSVWDPDEQVVLGTSTVEVERSGMHRFTIQLRGIPPASAIVTAGFVSDAGGTHSSVRAIRH